MNKKYFFIFFILIFFINQQVCSGPHLNQTLIFSKNKNFHEISRKCVYLIRKSGREILKNSCTSCRSVGITRKRSGIPTPIMRRYVIPANSHLVLPFRGPGQSRVKNDLACKGNSKSQNFSQEKKIKRKKKADTKCIYMQQSPSGKIVLINSCKTCRVAGLQRVNSMGRSLGRQFIKLQPQKKSIVKQLGAAQVKIIGDIECPK